MLGQQAVVLHKGRDLRRSLSLIVHCAVDLHVPVENLQETFLTLLGEEGEKDGLVRWRAKGEGEGVWEKKCVREEEHNSEEYD